jgi:hypothetical protein
MNRQEVPALLFRGYILSDATMITYIILIFKIYFQNISETNVVSQCII